MDDADGVRRARRVAGLQHHVDGVAADAFDGVARDEGSDATPDDSSFVDAEAADSDVADTTVVADSGSKPDTTLVDTFVPPTDTGKADTSTTDGSTTDAKSVVCGLTACTGGLSCIVTRSSVGAKYSAACETAPSSVPGGDCTVTASGYKCPQGYACTTKWPSGNVCEPLCSRKASDFGGRIAGETCTGGQCRAGTTCLCGTGLFGIDACAAKTGTCIDLCNTSLDCSGGKTCSALTTGSPYKGCM